MNDETIQTNVALARRFIEGVLGGQDPSAFDLIADDVWVSTGLKPTGPIEGKAEYGRILADTFGRGFSDGALVIDEIVATTDGRLVVRFTAKATHTGEVFGVAATGRRVTMVETHVLRFRDGKLVENWVGANNPLEFEMLFAPAIAPMLLAN